VAERAIGDAAIDKGMLSRRWRPGAAGLSSASESESLLAPDIASNAELPPRRFDANMPNSLSSASETSYWLTIVETGSAVSISVRTHSAILPASDNAGVG
jgi:hypothetical protein